LTRTDIVTLLGLPLHEYGMSPHLFCSSLKYGFSKSDMSTLKHNCKAHSEAKSKYFFSFENPIKACGLKAWNYVASDRKTTLATF